MTTSALPRRGTGTTPFPAATRAGLAAFTLGRVQLDDLQRIRGRGEHVAEQCIRVERHGREELVELRLRMHLDHLFAGNGVSVPSGLA